MHRLIHKQPLHHTSTGVTTSVKQVDVDIGNVSTFCAVAVLDSNTWKEVQFDNSLVSQIQENMRTSTLQKGAVKISKAISHPRVIQSSLTSSEASPEVNTTPDVNRAVVLSAKPVNDIDPEIEETLSSTLEGHGGISNFNRFLKKTFSFYMRDAGGQVEFQELISLLIIGPSIFFFIFRADLGLKSTFPVGYRTSATKSINCYTSSITTEEALLQCLSSVYAMDTPNQMGHNSLHPHVFIVATHKDRLGPSADQKIQELNAEVKSLIEKSGFKNLVQYADRVKGQVIICCR